MVMGSVTVGLLLTRITQYPSSRSARIVALGRLPDHDGPAAEDEDAVEVGPLGHRPVSAGVSYVLRAFARAPARPRGAGPAQADAKGSVGAGI